MLAAAIVEASAAGAEASVLASSELPLAAAGLVEEDGAVDFALPDEGWDEAAVDFDALSLVLAKAGILSLLLVPSFFAEGLGATEAARSGAAAWGEGAVGAEIVGVCDAALEELSLAETGAGVGDGTAWLESEEAAL